MNVVSSSIAAGDTVQDTEFEEFSHLFSGLPSSRLAVWNHEDRRKKFPVLFPGTNIKADDRVLFILNKRTMLAVFLDKISKRFRVRFYWLAFEYAPGYLSTDLTASDVLYLIAKFIASDLNMNVATAKSLGFQQVTGDCSQVVRYNNFHQNMMGKVFQTDSFVCYVKENESIE